MGHGQTFLFLQRDERRLRIETSGGEECSGTGRKWRVLEECKERIHLPQEISLAADCRVLLRIDDKTRGFCRWIFGFIVKPDATGRILPMQRPSPAEPAAAEPDFSESEPRTTEAEDALIRAATRQILQDAEAEPIPEHLRKLATELAEALQKQRAKGEVSPSEGDPIGGPTI